METISIELEIKIIEKIRGIYLIKKLSGERPFITVAEFKFIIGTYRIKKQNWFDLAKEIEKKGLVEVSPKSGRIYLKKESLNNSEIKLLPEALHKD